MTSRTEDIPLLIEYFVEKLSEINGVQKTKINFNHNNMYTYNWPGNVRELRNLIERVTILSSNETKSNVNKLIEDILNPSSSLTARRYNGKIIFSSIKGSTEYFEKEYLITQFKKIMAIYPNR